MSIFKSNSPLQLLCSVVTSTTLCHFPQQVWVLSSVQAFPDFPSVSPTTIFNESSLEPQIILSPSYKKPQPFIPLTHPWAPSCSEHRLVLATRCPSSAQPHRSDLSLHYHLHPPHHLREYYLLTRHSQSLASASNGVSKNSARNTQNLPKIYPDMTLRARK